jgi:hypothetical protein
MPPAIDDLIEQMDERGLIEDHLAAWYTRYQPPAASRTVCRFAACPQGQVTFLLHRRTVMGHGTGRDRTLSDLQQAAGVFASTRRRGSAHISMLGL